MMWLFDLGLFPFSRFWMRAYWLLPIWLLMEINSGMGPRDGVGHWAHVGGFLFGALRPWHCVTRDWSIKQQGNRAKSFLDAGPKSVGQTS